MPEELKFTWNSSSGSSYLLHVAFSFAFKRCYNSFWVRDSLSCRHLKKNAFRLPSWQLSHFISSEWASRLLVITSLLVHLVFTVVPFWRSFLRSTAPTGNRRSASPAAATMWCWAAWSGARSTRSTSWLRTWRASPGPVSCPSSHPQSRPPSQVLVPHQPQSNKPSALTRMANF